METWTLKRRPSWMHVADPRIMLALRRDESPTSAHDLREREPYPYTYIVQRCERLAAEGLVQPTADDRYVLRELGQEFLAGEVPIRHLESGTAAWPAVFRA